MQKSCVQVCAKSKPELTLSVDRRPPDIVLIEGTQLVNAMAYRDMLCRFSAGFT
jgi:hypothetical protein